MIAHGLEIGALGLANHMARLRVPERRRHVLVGKGPGLLVCCKDGSECPVEISLRPVQRGLETLVVAVIHDASDPSVRDWAASQAPARVVVVDDNVDAASTTATLLQMCGHDVNVTHSGQEAMALALAQRPDVILLDIGLPDIDGYGIARAIRSNPQLQHVRLVALSGFGSEEDKRRAHEAGFDAHLTKPAELAVLQEAIAGAARTS